MASTYRAGAFWAASSAVFGGQTLPSAVALEMRWCSLHVFGGQTLPSAVA